MIFISSKKLLQYYLPSTLTLFMLVTIERVVITDGGNDRLYGLPFPYITSSYGYSFHYDIYVLAMLANLLFYFLLTIFLFKLFEKLGAKLKTHWLLIAIGIAVSIFWIATFALIIQDSSFYLKTDSKYKTTDKHLIFGIRP